MKVFELQITEFLSNTKIQFVVPIYQRNYDWKIAQCEELLNDILVAEKNNVTHFVGSIVYIYDGIHGSREVRELVIIDGQQRLTTINILYVALYRFAKENNMPQKEEIYNVFLTNQYIEDASCKLKLKQTDSNAKAFQAIIDEKEEQLEKYSNVKENFYYFKEKINQDNFNKIFNGLKKLIFVEIALERGKDDPQRIFESLNSTGIDLSQSDLIRNFVLMHLEPEDQNRVYKNIWLPIEENAQFNSGAVSMVSDFMRDYITLQTKNIPNKNKVYYEFKKRYNKKGENFELELENIKKFSYHYKKIINPETVSDQEIKKELCYISRLKINVAFPFLLQIFEDYENKIIDQVALIKILKLIQSFVWRRFVVNASTNALNKIFMTLHSKIKPDNYLKSLENALLSNKAERSRFPSNKEVESELLRKDLYNINNQNRDYLFELLENYNNREIVDTASDAITVEHIFPCNPSNKWKAELRQEEFTDFSENKLNTIANLTLSGNNGSLGNLSFIEKRDKNDNNGEQGYKYSRLWLNDYLKEQDQWNIEKYNERFKIIYERFIKIWSIPLINNDSPLDYENLESNIFDAEEPKSKNLEYFIFEDKKIDEKNFTRMYIYVLRELYRKNPELFLNNKKIKVSSKKDDFRSPKEVENGYYVEGNTDSNSKFYQLKDVLKIFSLEDQLSIKYKFQFQS